MNLEKTQNQAGNTISEEVKYTPYQIKAIFQTPNGYTKEDTVVIVAENEETAKEVLLEMYIRMEEFFNEMLDVSEIENSTITVLEVKEFDSEPLKNIDLVGTKPIGYGRFHDCYGTYEELIEFLTGYDDYSPELIRIFIEVPMEDDRILFYFKNRFDNTKNRQAIRDCVRRGIDPFGY
ncbi:MAG: hypothetical protein K0R54_799 [Clostridiaceae bacterium]|jgi:hypothetical protein|nr:hypothetical protein [Clostridiaceae bacterium]